MGIGQRLLKWFGGPTPEDFALGGASVPDARAELTTSKELEEVLIAMGTDVRSGVSVSPEGAVAVASVAAAVGILAESIAQIPLIIYRRRADGGKDRATDHPLWPLLHDKPNAFQNTFEFREMMQLHLALHGNAYALKNRANGRIAELLPLHPTRVNPEQQDDFRVVYKIMLPPNGERVEMSQRDILHLRDRSFDGVMGKSRIQTNREAIGLAMATERYGAKFFGNNARPSGVLSTEQKLTPEQINQIRESWKAAVGGESQLGTAVLDAAMKWQPLQMTSTDAQFLENRKFQIAEVSRIFRVPPHMLGDLDRATFSNIEQQSIEFVKFTLMPWLRRWEAALNTQLIDRDEGRDFFAEFLVEGLMRGTSKERAEFYQIMIQNKLMSPNEVRERENMNPREGGDTFENPAITPGDSDNRETVQ